MNLVRTQAAKEYGYLYFFLLSKKLYFILFQVPQNSVPSSLAKVNSLSHVLSKLPHFHVFCPKF